MFMQPVSSSDIRAIGYDADTSTLKVAFHSGGVYQYWGVPVSVHRALISASSKGRYLHAYIKNRYPGNRAG